MAARFSALFTWLLLCLLGAAALPAHAQAQPEPAPITAVRLSAGERLALNGRMDHPAWQRAPAFSAFVEKMPVLGAAPLQATEVRVLFDDQAVYVGVRAFEPHPQALRAPLVRHDQVNRTQDFVVVYLDGIGSRRAAQFFRLNAAGAMADGMHTDADDSEDFSPDFDWDGAVAHEAGAWTAVFRLPFASLRFAEGQAPADWRILVGRRLPREQFHLFTSSFIGREASSFIATMQPLQGVRLPAEHAFLTLRPSVTALARRERGESGGEATSTHGDASLDVKWRPRAELVVDATLNPDFSQLAVDVPPLSGNTRFALSLPEKRPFFFEASDLLRSPAQAVYTRSFTEPRAGLRATWRGNTWAGSGLLVSDRGGGLVLLPGTYGTGAVAQPASTTLLLRGRLDAGQAQWGGLVSTRRYAQDQGENTVLGPDVALALPADWRLRAQWLQSSTTARSDGSTPLAHGPARQGYLLTARLQRINDTSEQTYTVEDIAQGFRQDAGFIYQAGVRRFKLFLARPLLRQQGPFNELWANVNAEHVQDRTSGRLVAQNLIPGLWGTGAANLEWWLEWNGLARLRTQADAPVLAQRFLAGGLVFTPATWFPLLDVNGRFGRLADTQAQALRPGAVLNASARLRPAAWLELEPSGSRSWLRQGGHSVYDEYVAQLLAVAHVNARQHVRLIVQQTRSLRRSDTGSGQAGGARVATLGWSHRFSAGTLLHLGASHESARPGRAATQEAFVKWQLDAEDLRSAAQAAWFAPPAVPTPPLRRQAQPG